MMRVLFLHPDLGIGGAERLVVDAALGLQRKGHKVSILTNHHDPNHCFQETRDNTLQVETVGDWLPRKVFGRFSAICAYVRMIYAALYTAFITSRNEHIDVIICDLISIGIPFLKLAKDKPKVIYYCHYPDQLLTTKQGFLRKLYRLPIDYFEEVTTGYADRVLVNSTFTRGVFRKTFKRLAVIPDVLHPSLDTDFFDKTEVSDDEVPLKLPKNPFIFLSINRYERKKNLPLAIQALHRLQSLVSPAEYDRCHLIIAGGYDPRVLENVQHYEELEKLSSGLDVANKVTFLKSPTDKQKIFLLKKCDGVIYTPANEHFGIVPLEAMYMSKPVIAANSGGPTETIIHNNTGFLCEQNEQEFAKAMVQLLRDIHLGNRMGEMGRKRVQSKFSFQAFADRLDRYVLEWTEGNKNNGESEKEKLK